MTDTNTLLAILYTRIRHQHARDPYRAERLINALEFAALARMTR